MNDKSNVFDQPLKSVFEDILWPAVPNPNGAAKLAMLFQLEQSQWLSPEKIREHQFVQISKLLQHCIKHVPYYSEVLAGIELSDQIDEHQWHSIPVLSRDMVQQAGKRLTSTFVPESHGRVFSKRTSGSTGKPIETLGTGITNYFWDVFTIRDHLWHHRDFSGKLAVIRFTLEEQANKPEGISSKVWGKATKDLVDTGTCSVLSILTPITTQIEWLVKENPDYLLTHPSVLTELVLHCQKEGIELPALREVRTISEALPDGLREMCRDVWGVGLTDTYSTIELGYLALQCPEYSHYHVQSESVYLEVLDENNSPCKAGEIGRVVVTDLHNFAFPLVRYEVGDYAEVGEACGCGRGLPVLKQIKGRYRNILMTPDGERRYPQLGIQDLHEIAPVQQFQAIQRTIDEIDIKLVLPRPLETEERAALISKFQDMLGTCFKFNIQQVEKISRSASGKYEEFISMLKPRSKS